MRLHLTLWMWLVLDAGATARLTRLIGKDTITAPIRDRVYSTSPRRQAASRRTERRRRAAFDFLTCPWCTSVWVAAGALALSAWQASWWQWVAAGLTFSLIAGLVGERT